MSTFHTATEIEEGYAVGHLAVSNANHPPLLGHGSPAMRSMFPPSKKLIAKRHDKKMKDLMRVQRRCYSLIDESTQEDFYLMLESQKKSYQVRVIKLELPTGETETLLTNLGRKSFKKSEFMALYFKRWPIETKYNTLKNKLEIENFSGRMLISVQQDFYATMYISNLVAITKIMTNEGIKKQTKDKELNYKYQTNES